MLACLLFAPFAARPRVSFWALQRVLFFSADARAEQSGQHRHNGARWSQRGPTRDDDATPKTAVFKLTAPGGLLRLTLLRGEQTAVLLFHLQNNGRKVFFLYFIESPSVDAQGRFRSRHLCAHG